jgi:hypothetical protein
MNSLYSAQPLALAHDNRAADFQIALLTTRIGACSSDGRPMIRFMPWRYKCSGRVRIDVDCIVVHFDFTYPEITLANQSQKSPLTGAL